MAQQIPVAPDARADAVEAGSDAAHAITEDLAYRRSASSMSSSSGHTARATAAGCWSMGACAAPPRRSATRPPPALARARAPRRSCLPMAISTMSACWRIWPARGRPGLRPRAGKTLSRRQRGPGIGLCRRHAGTGTARPAHVSDARLGRSRRFRALPRQPETRARDHRARPPPTRTGPAARPRCPGPGLRARRRSRTGPLCRATRPGGGRLGLPGGLSGATRNTQRAPSELRAANPCAPAS